MALVGNRDASPRQFESSCRRDPNGGSTAGSEKLAALRNLYLILMPFVVCYPFTLERPQRVTPITSVAENRDLSRAEPTILRISSLALSPPSRNVRRFSVQVASRILCAFVVCVGAPVLSSSRLWATAWAQNSTSASNSENSSQQGTRTEQTTSATSQNSQAPESDSQYSDDHKDPVTLFPHSDTSRYWISGQANIILQWHPEFPAKYSGPNSLHAEAENATSKVYTLYLGYELTHTTEVFLDLESAGGHGISQALGLAGFTNLDVVRNPTLGETPYVARVMLRQIIPLTSERVEADRDEFHLATSLTRAANRIPHRQIWAGRFLRPEHMGFG